MIPQAVKRKYDAVQPHVREVASRVREAVLRFCERNAFAYTGRTKSESSVAEKLETGRFSSWAKIEDIFACSIVIPTLDDEPRALDFLRSSFVEQSVRLRGSQQKHPESFRFDATRFYGRLNIPPGLMTDSAIGEMVFEVQIRSAFEHAWSVATHALAYKSGQVDWKMQRLSAQLKAAVEQLDALVRAFEKSSETIVEYPWPETIAKTKLLHAFSGFVEGGKIPQEMAPANWSRFAGNTYDLLKSTRRFRVAEAERHADDAIACVADYLASGRPVPLSISLFQFAAGVLCESEAIKGPVADYWLLVTPELRTFHPGVDAIGPCVDLDH